jgi:chemosensory pili system protein ChpA (sensor histidine kinase/response regulator)
LRTDELLNILREELDSCGPDIDGVLMAWLGDPKGSVAYAPALQEHLRRMSAACGVIGLDGIAAVFGWIAETGQSLAEETQHASAKEEAELGAWLTWLAGWQQALSRFFESPTQDDAASTIVDFVACSPRPMRLTDLQVVADALRRGPSVSSEMLEDTGQSDHDATDDDVSLQLPEDIDAGLLDVFLQESPAQLARLASFVQAMIEGRASAADMVEAQRVAHTFKGSGNIIGIRGVGRLAHHIEDVLAFSASDPSKPTESMWRDLQQAVACLDQMVYALRGDERAPADGRHWMQRMIDWGRAIRSGDLVSEDVDMVSPGRPGHGSAGAPQDPGNTPSAAMPESVQPSVVETASDTNAPPPGEGEPAPALRIELEVINRLVRRTGQGLVQHGRMNEHVRVIELHAKQLMASNGRLLQHLRSLEVALDRQAVSLQEKADESSAFLDPLEMDRYNELHALTRFAAEMAADELDHARGAHQELEHAAAILRKHGTDLREQYREMNILRLVPVRNIVARLRRTVSQAAAATGKQARLVVEGDQVKVDSAMLERLTEPLLHLLRNAVDHGIEVPADRELLGKPACGEIRISVKRVGGQIHIEVQDDGVGLDLGAIHARAVSLGLLDDEVEASADEVARLILLPGFSTRNEVTEISGRGVGLDVVAERVRTMMGRLTIRTEPLTGSTFTLALPSGGGVEHALVVEVAEVQYALPSTSVALALAAVDGTVDGRELSYGQRRLPRVWLGAWLGQAEPADLETLARPHVIVHCGGGEVALVVDRVVDSREMILQDIGNHLRRVLGIGGGVLLPDGRVLFTLDIESLSTSDTPLRRLRGARQLPRTKTVARKHVLVVDDALSVRKSLQQLVQDAGFDVSLARDGQDALDVLHRRAVSIVLTDLEMPTLNGLELTKRVRNSPHLADTPIVMITSRSSDKHRLLAANAGVDVFLTKPHSDEHLMTEIRRLLA